MPVPTSMSDLSLTAGSNSPAGSEAIGNSLDNYLRAGFSILKSTNSLASASIASASTTDLASADAESVQVTGTTTITSFGTGFVGCKREVRFSGALTITSSANIVLPNSANITTGAGDVLTFRCTGSGVWLLTGKPRIASSEVTTALGYTPANKAGDTFSGPVGIVGNTGYLYRDSNGTLALRAATDDLVTQGFYSWTAAGVFSTPGLAVAGGATAASLTLSAGKVLTKVTLSNAAPGALANGELYLRY